MLVWVVVSLTLPSVPSTSLCLESSSSAYLSVAGGLPFFRVRRKMPQDSSSEERKPSKDGVLTFFVAFYIIFERLLTPVT